MTPTDFSAYRDALRSLDLALHAPTSHLSQTECQMIQDSIIQRFEYTYELAWKAMKRCLETEEHLELDQVGRKELFRRAFEFGLIENPRTWFRYQESRNQTAHAYDHSIAVNVLQSVEPFFKDALGLLKVLEQRYGAS